MFQSTQTSAAHPVSVTGDAARQRLLSDLPVGEARCTLAGISTAIVEGGAGPPIVLLHGPGEHALKWMRVIPALVATHTVIAPDLPGHGESNGGEPVDAQGVLDWLDALIIARCSEPPVLVGQIIAGAIAARFASERRRQLSRLVLVDALGLTPFSPAPAFARALTEFGAEPTPDRHDRLWAHCAFDLGGLRAALGERWDWLKAYNLYCAGRPELKVVQLGLMQQFGLPAIPSEALGRIDVPTALIWGRHDLATALEVAEATAARYGWPVHIIEQAADDPPIEQPQAFIDVLQKLLRGESR